MVFSSYFSLSLLNATAAIFVVVHVHVIMAQAFSFPLCCPFPSNSRGIWADCADSYSCFLYGSENLRVY